MEPETINAITYWITLITLLVQYIGGIFLVVTAGLEALKNKAIRVDRIVTVGIVLILIPYGIRNYGLELADASIDLLNGLTDKRPEIEAAIERFLNENNPGSGDTAATVPSPESTPIPQPQSSPTPNMFELTATAYFGENFPTALPAQSTATPIPTIQATVNAAANSTPLPTVFICQTAADVGKGCLVASPTPMPGN